MTLKTEDLEYIVDVCGALGCSRGELLDPGDPYSPCIHDGYCPRVASAVEIEGWIDAFVGFLGRVSDSDARRVIVDSNEDAFAELISTRIHGARLDCAAFQAACGCKGKEASHA
jgi:hypothetical protein